MNWNALAEFCLTVVSISGVLAYVGRRAVDAFFQSRIETHKAELQRSVTEHSVRFQKLHAERAEVIKDFYAQLAVLDNALVSTLRLFQAIGERPLTEKVSQLAEYYNSLAEYFLPRRIFFDAPMCNLIDDILDTARGIFFDITAYQVDPQHPENKFDRQVLLERHEFWDKARATHKQEFAELKTKLETEFRGILGIVA